MICSFAFAACVIAQSSTSSPQCVNPNADVSLLNALVPDYPDSARELNAGAATVLAEVTVGVDGKPTDVTIYKSSGNMAMDREAIRTARASKYVPKLIDCKPVTGQYLFRAEFNPNPPPEHIRTPRIW